MAKTNTKTKVQATETPATEANETKGREKVVLTADDNKVINEMAKDMTTSSKIRYLRGLGWSRSKVALALKIRYQHVRNVEITPLKKAQA